MTEEEWNAFLKDYSRELLADEKLRSSVPPEALAPDWLGYSPASEEDIAAAEARLGTRFPPSYRTFLRVSNGWRVISPSIWKMWPCTQVAWFKERNQEWIDAYNDPRDKDPNARPISDAEYLVYGDAQDTAVFREEHLQTALEISDRGDDAIFLLNPKTVTPEGEWEAWLFANWYPGARRYPSFQKMMEETRIDLRKMHEKQKPRAAQPPRPKPKPKPWWKIW